MTTLIPTVSDVTFNEEDHTYFYGMQRIPSVSELLRPLTDAYLASIPEGILNRKRDLGLAVHRAAELIDTGYELDPDTIDPDVNGYLEAYKRFLVDMRPKWASVERTVFDADRWYAGRLDRSGTVNGQTFVVDIKTAATLSTATAVQLTAYAEADSDWGSGIAALQLLPKGEYKFVPLQREPKTWEALLTIHAFKGVTK